MARSGDVLDIGTHTGDFKVRIGERTAADRLYGVEFIAEHAEVARSRGVLVAEADLEDGLPYDNDSFDVATANQVIEHLRGTDRFLSEVRRVLRPGASPASPRTTSRAGTTSSRSRSASSRTRCTSPTR